jgi:enoyl-CoA hydratase
MEYKNIILSIESGIAAITLNRPEFMNALCRELDLELLDAFSALENDSSARVLILSGSRKFFAAGADVSAMKDANPQEALAVSSIGHAVHDALERLPFPTIAAVNGPALGGGCELAISCDFIVAGEGALFGLPEVGLGILPGGGGTQRLIHLVGLPLAREMVLLGKRISGREAVQAGLAHQCVPDEEVKDAAFDIAEKLLKKPAQALRLAKRALNESARLAMAPGLELEKLLFSMAFATYDQKEGMAAFLEKRKPVFKNE